MSEYTDFWKSLDLPVDQTQKAADFNMVNDNADQLTLTDAEQYNLGWGMDATPEAWVKAKAKEIQDQINGAKSTEVLKRGLNKAPLSPEELAAKEKEDATTTASEKAAAAIRNNDSGSGGDYGGPANTSAPSEVSTTLGFDGFSKDGAKLGYAVAGPLGAATGAVLGGITMTPTLSAAAIAREDANRERAAQAMRDEAAAASASAQQQAANAAQAQAQADAAAGIGPAGMGGGGYDSSVGSATNSDRADGGWGGGSGGFGTGPGSGGTSASDSDSDSRGGGYGGGGHDPG